MNRLQRLVRGVVNKTGLGAYDRILMDRSKGIDDTNTIMENTYEKLDLVFSCISYTAKAISQVPLYVMKLDKKSDKYFPVGERDPWQKLLDQPNYMTSKVSFVTSILSYLLLDGIVAIIPFPPSLKETPSSLWCVPWKFCSYKLDLNGHLVNWEYKPNRDNGPKHLFKPHELFQVKFWNPDNQMEGWAPIKAGKLPIMETYKSSQWNTRFFDQGATPGGVLSTPQKLNKDTIELIRDQWTQRHEGYGQSHKIAVLHQDLKYQSTGISQKDMDFANLRNLSREAIMQVFGMKKVIMGITEGLNYAVAREQRKEWWNGTCLPIMRMVSDALTFGLFRNETVYDTYYNYRVQFDISSIEALHEDYAVKVKTSEGLFRMGVSFEDINDMLELGFEKRDWHKLSYVPVNMMCVNYKDVGRENPNAGNSPDGQPDLPPEPIPNEDPYADSTAASLIEFVKKDWDKQFNYMVSVIESNMKPFTKQLAGRLRRLVFDMRTKSLKIVLEKEGDLKQKAQLINFNFELERTLVNVREPWLGMSNWIGQFIITEKVDSNPANVMNEGIIEELFKGFSNTVAVLVEEKKDDVTTILLTKQNQEEVAKEIRSLFNLSLTQVWPLVKEEIRRLSRLYLVESARPSGGDDELHNQE